MNVNDTEVLLCNCGKTMPLDAKKISSGCNIKEPPEIYNSLCTDQINEFEKALKNCSDENKPLLIACTYQAKLFSEIAEENEIEIPYMFNIRENAGWSKSAKKASSKISSMILDATRMATSSEITRSMEFNSVGRCLIYGPSDAVLYAAKGLSEFLGVTALITDNEQILPPKNSNFLISTGKVTNLSGYFCNFDLKINDFAEALPYSREYLVFGNRSNDVSSQCDIFIDLSDGDPLLTAHNKRDGYFKVDSKDPLALEKLISDTQSKIGEFEKPIYVSLDDTLCAHSRNQINGCSKCLDACPAGAIKPNGDVVEIDTAICGGCGMCGSVCPSGAAQVIWPSIDKLLNRLSYIAENFIKLEKAMPRLLIHDETHGSGIISFLSRVYDGLPYDVIPIEIHSIGRSGHDLLIGANAMGFSEIIILADPNKSSENEVLHNQVKLANSLLSGIGINEIERFKIYELSDPEEFNDIINLPNNIAKYNFSPFVATGTSKSIVRTAIKGLAKENKYSNEIIELPDNAPYGKVEVNSDGCTLCLACVSVCPAGALQDNPETPQLLFREDACLQCGLCQKTCPEKVISLIPQYNLSDSALSNEIINEDEPFPCIKCGKIFGTKKSIESIKNRLTSHSMFLSEEKQNLILMCEDCRVSSQFEQNDKILDVEDRPKPRTTDDYN